MKALMVLLTIILLQSCGQVAITNTEVCDGIKKICPIKASTTEEKNQEESADANSKTVDQTLLLNRIMRSL